MALARAARDRFMAARGDAPMAIEEAFDIEIDDSDAEALRTVADVEAYVAKRLS